MTQSDDQIMDRIQNKPLSEGVIGPVQFSDNHALAQVGGTACPAVPPKIFQDVNVEIVATIPIRAASLIAEKALEENLKFQEKAGYYIVLGLEAERSKQ